MRPEQQPDWRSKEGYAYTTKLTRLGWAWEFLRRNPDFQADYRRTSQQYARTPCGDLRRWGVLRADDPLKSALEAQVFWDPNVCPHVLPLVAGRRVADACGDRLRSPHVRHVLICDKDRRLQLSVQISAPVEPDVVLTDAVILPSEETCRWHALICFNDYLASGHLSRRYFRSERMTGRLARVAQALDGALLAASHREIAIALYGRARVFDDWNDPGEYLRDCVRRAIRRGRLLMAGGYRQFLR